MFTVDKLSCFVNVQFYQGVELSFVNIHVSFFCVFYPANVFLFQPTLALGMSKKLI